MTKRKFDAKREGAFLKEQILSFFFPPKCAVCKTCGYEPLCPTCRERVEKQFRPKKFLAPGGNGFADEMLALFPYSCREVKILVFGWKRHPYSHYPEIFGKYSKIAMTRKEAFSGIDLVTFAPRRPQAVRSAGFDQAQELAKEVARGLNLPIETLLIRRGRSRPQRALSAEERIRNVRGVFCPARPLSGETVLLIDDVVTTGASVRECARILKGAGAQRVYVLTLAHTFDC